MKLRWGNERIKGLSDPIRTAEEINDWTWWGLFAVVVLMVVLVILKVSGKI